MHLFVFFVVVAGQIHRVMSVTHTLNYFMTTSSKVAKLPEYWESTYVDGVQILHYDSKSRNTTAKQEWMNKITENDPYFWERETDGSIGNEQILKNNIEIAKERFNETGGVHMFQVIQGCAWDDETHEVDGWEYYSYDGEDFISFDVTATRWIAAQPQAMVTKHKLDQNINYKKHVLTELCRDQLKKHLHNGKDFLMRIELPTVSLLQKTPSSPVTCHASGFYPSTSALFWRKDGEELHEDVEIGELLPNHDGTFQTTAQLKVEVTPEAEGRYDCVFQMAGVKEDIVVKLEGRNILSNARIQDAKMMRSVAILTLAILMLMLALLVLLAKIHISRQAKYFKAPVSSGPDLMSTSDSETASK
ncbi:major histocompatibility complex class I-related protein 1-like [Festucalex cinctus]